MVAAGKAARRDVPRRLTHVHRVADRSRSGSSMLVVTLSHGGRRRRWCSARSSSPPVSGGSDCCGGRRPSGPQAARAASASSTRARSSRSPTARSPRRSTSRSASSPRTRSASRRSSCSASASLFLIVSLSYAEGTAALPETGGAATFVRRASNDLAGFMTGWALFLDYLIVIALSALFLPHYLAGALQVSRARPLSVGRRRRGRRDRARRAACALVRRPSLYGVGIVVPALDLLTQLLLVVLGFVLVFSPHALTHGTSLGTNPSWHDARVRAAARDARVHRARDGREPRRGGAAPGRRPAALGVRRRSRPSSTVYVAIAVVALSAFPGPKTELGTTLGARAAARRRRPASATSCPWHLGGVLRFYVGVTGALILLAAVTTSISGFSRLAYSLGEHGQLPRELRAAEPARARLAARDRLGGGGLVGDRDRARRSSRARRRVPREPLLVRRAARVHRRAARGDQAADRRARPARGRIARRSTCTIRGSDDPAARDRRCGRDVRDLGDRAGDAPGRALRRPVWLARRPRRLRRRSAVARRGPARAGRGARRAARRRRRAVQADPRSDEARHDRRGDARDRGEARRRARGGGAGAPRDPRPARAAARRAAASTRTSGPRRRSPRRSCSARTTASTVEGTTVRARAIGQAIVERGRARSAPT